MRLSPPPNERTGDQPSPARPAEHISSHCIHLQPALPQGHHPTPPPTPLSPHPPFTYLTCDALPLVCFPLPPFQSPSGIVFRCARRSGRLLSSNDEPLGESDKSILATLEKCKKQTNKHTRAWKKRTGRYIRSRSSL